MRIDDKTGGFWTDIIVRKKLPEVAFKQNYTTDAVANNMLAEEAISAIKGSVKHKFSIRHVRGKLVIARFSDGKYSTGILQRKSPDGTPYAPLSETTLAMRKADGNSRGPAFILRETGKHIMDGLKIISRNTTRKGMKFEIGWVGEDAKRASEHNAGFGWTIVYENSFGEKRFYDVTVPARPFIGLSKEFVENIQKFWNKLAK